MATNHALDILNSERYKLKDMIRTCQRNSDIMMSNVPYDEYEKQLREVVFALDRIKLAPRGD